MEIEAKFQLLEKPISKGYGDEDTRIWVIPFAWLMIWSICDYIAKKQFENIPLSVA